MCSKFLVASLTLAFGALFLQAQTPPLPELPKVDISGFPPVVKEQVAAAYNLARANSGDANASGKLGMLLELYKQREWAEICYQRAHLLDRSAFGWLYYLGSLQYDLGKRAEATATLRSALSLKPNYLPAWLKLADNLLGAGDWEAAGIIYEAILKERADVAEAHYGLGRIRAANGDLTAAIASYRKACELFPPYGAARYGLAMAYKKLGDRARSEEELKLHAAGKALVPPVSDPWRDELSALDRGASSILRHGVALQEAGRVEDAIAEHEKALELDPELVPAHSNLIILYGRTKQPQKAEEHFRAAVRLNPNSADSYYNYGVLLFEQQKYPEAEEVYKKAVESNPFHSQALHNLGLLLEQQGRLDEALEYYRKAVERQPNYPLAHFHIGRILANQKKYDEAISHFLMTLSPEDESTSAYLYALFATYARAGNREEALKYGRRARELAAARGQTELLRSIDRDLRTLEATAPR